MTTSTRDCCQVMSHSQPACERIVIQFFRDVTVVYIFSLRFRWYFVEYVWFYLDSSSNAYTLHVSLTAVGDANDAINTSSSANGKQFVVSGNSCITKFGPWWYTAAGYCCHSRLFGGAGNGFVWSSIGTTGQLTIGRMMIKQTN
jgi:hypothetical protein